MIAQRKNLVNGLSVVLPNLISLLRSLWEMKCNVREVSLFTRVNLII